MDIVYVKPPVKSEEKIFVGQIAGFGSHTQSTHLGSCVSLILYSARLRKGCISHIGGSKHSMGPYNFPNEVLAYESELEKQYSIPDPFYYVIGGSDSSIPLAQMTEDELKEHKKRYKIVDVGGRFYRAVKLIPLEARIEIHKMSLFDIKVPKLPDIT
jgi:hypothetical protein